MNDAVRLLNATSTGESLRFQDSDEDLRAFDLLPTALQHQVDWNNTKMAATWALEQLKRARASGRFVGGEATASVCRKTANTEMYEIAVFAGEYFAQTGCKYPHTAAEASIQRYGHLGPSKHPPRRYGKPVFRRQHPKRRR